ncbi:hypothetical protein WOLCODRAFT_76096 [Wolfiporia cocos MD-104 SS10]|uniref:Uncharacterized protein n=1 Tax=Wolfiporia cocos (strain MD-104) TaxID=742152 RepID=A0A2H3JZP8_WOLCO|nr:hypothetical protein WOLCODRAFT_76096 [Wolfiporia cocos MD-104 SS10]
MGHRRTWDEFDAILDTPSKRIRLMTAGIASTASGSFLLSKTPINAMHNIAPPVLERVPMQLPNPDWGMLQQPSGQQSHTEMQHKIDRLTENLHLAHEHTHARDAIIEGAHAQLVIQDMYGEKLNQALYTKEHRSETDRTKLFPEGRGRHLNNVGFIEELDRVDKVRRKSSEAKGQRKMAKQQKKVEKELIEPRWKGILTQHKRAVDGWKQECERLIMEGVAKKDLPKPPKQPLKPKPAVGQADTAMNQAGGNTADVGDDVSSDGEE